MTDRIDALRKLKACVETDSGDYSFKDLRTAGFHNHSRLFVEAKANGSLDAARALHEAVLPGFDWSVEADDQAEVWTPPEQGEDGKFFVRHSALSGWCSRENPARGWLLAILTALIAKEEQSQ